MSVVDRARPPRPLHAGKPAPASVVSEPSADLQWWIPVVAGALPAAGTWLLIALPALVLWVSTAHTSVGWLPTVGVASGVWFLGQGAPIAVGAIPITVTPLGLWLLALVLTARSLGRLLDRTERATSGTTWPTLLIRRVLPGFTAGYAGVALVAGLLALTSDARPHPLGLPLVLIVPVLATVWCLVRRYTQEREAGPVGEWLDRAPRSLTRALVPGVVGTSLVLATGVLLLLVMVVVRFSTVSGLNAAVGAGLLGGVLLTLGQLLLVPNLALWGVAWLAGPGFQVADGSPINLAGAKPGLLPLLPVLGALPSDGVWSRWLLALLLLPVLGGVAIGWLACRGIARLASWRTKLATSASAAVVTTLLLTLLGVLGGGSAGVDRLAHVGGHPFLVGLALLGELGVGAALFVGAAQLRIRLQHSRAV